MQYEAHAKVNIFLKIVGIRGNYHELFSRFMLVSHLFDTLSFVPKSSRMPFELVGDFNCALEQNTVYKIFQTLQKHGFDTEIQNVMHHEALHVNKRIPSGAGLGGGSSDAATFLKMLNDRADLKLSAEDMMALGAEVGADVAFFASGYTSANVRGIGEKVEAYDEAPLDLDVFTPPLACDTARVYRTYREYFLQFINPSLAASMVDMSSEALLQSFGKEELNDLYPACLQAYPELRSYEKEGWFFSGSGSSFFRMKEK
ncbi:4-(cytidine 5'-diphospho)-2-C-methyl-D-erythritol kinase [Sulfurospirillum barnesii]|uniref:4-diphosphocytidyl-2-C-methyl-D-erythritol kinase n=1 Tax=Sulfurospirillum barnesii (strain ATCC 700032 / DSM 10660 / SES-3) TaxID=760154 RepID=I3XYG2_SULBS|nr:4-(cytidine 5'-diphospho)-2-C-methyl-D-erythritol kinase [Sulfurospirillum barnesii]AFL68986.1 4-diphosphocytidyl-2-C-methyl-D-erythritol kinase [Sulfurospirillum barnesii SES-3]